MPEETKVIEVQEDADDQIIDLAASLEASDSDEDEKPEVEDSEDSTTAPDVDVDAAEDKESEEEEPGKEATEDKEEEKVDPVQAELAKLREEQAQLRQIARTQRKELAAFKAARGTEAAKAKALAEAGTDELGEPIEPKEVDSSKLEQLQTGINNVMDQKGPQLELLLETMAMNQKFEDVAEVCSRENFDDIFEAAAREISKDGRDFDEVLLEIELGVWQQKNPYLYMYNLIKELHPSYASDEGTEESDKKKVAKPGEKQKKTGTIVKKPAVAPETIVDLGGSGNDSKSGWTAKKIEDIPEDELHKVPGEIYEKYMLGDLK